MMKVVLDCIVDNHLLEDEQMLNRLARTIDLASSMPQQSQLLLLTNSNHFLAKHTGHTEVHFIHDARYRFKRLLLNYRLKKIINQWGATLILHSGMLPNLKKQNNAIFIQSSNKLANFSTIKKLNPTFFYTASVFIQQQLIHHYKIPIEKIAITPFSIHPLYKTISWEQRESLKSNYCNDTEFILYNHSSIPAEDLVPLLQAFSRFKKRLQTNMKLLIPGSSSLDKKSSPLLETYSYKEDVVFTETICIKQLAAVTAAAYAVIYNGQQEALSQIQDILQCAVPVLLLQPQAWEKNELCFDYANPRSAEEIANKLMHLYKDENHRNQLIKSSQQLIPQFSKQATAKTFQEALLRTVAE